MKLVVYVFKVSVLMLHLGAEGSIALRRHRFAMHSTAEAATTVGNRLSTAYRKDVQHEEVAPFLGELEVGFIVSCCLVEEVSQGSELGRASHLLVREQSLSGSSGEAPTKIHRFPGGGGEGEEKGRKWRNTGGGEACHSRDQYYSVWYDCLCL